MRLIAIFLALAVLVIIPFVIWGETFDILFSQQAAVDRLRDAGPVAAVFAIGLLIADLFLPVPATSIMAALGIVFGPLVGGLIGTIGSFLSGLLAYTLCRLLGKRGALVLLGERDLKRASQLFATVGVWLVMLSRWLPVFPEVIACMAGLTRMRLELFLLALICGSLPMAFVFAVAGHIGADQPLVTTAICALAPIVLWWLVRRVGKPNTLLG